MGTIIPSILSLSTRVRAPSPSLLSLLPCPILTKLHTIDLDVFTKNRRDVQLLSQSHPPPGKEPISIAFVAVGAMLVGSIVETKHQGALVSRGEELGYFAYGGQSLSLSSVPQGWREGMTDFFQNEGSTVIILLPPGTTKWDEDLLVNSRKGLETAVNVGDQIGAFVKHFVVLHFFTFVAILVF